MFIISEIFPQHGGDLNVAEQMILQSKLNGANAVKVQLYPHDLFPSTDGLSRKYFEMSFEDLVRLKTYSDRVGITLFATPFTNERLEWCVELDLGYLKVASRTHRENPGLVEKILSVNKPTFVSLPFDFNPEDAVKAKNAIYLYCVPKYPTLLEEMRMPSFTSGLFSGLSDHSFGISAALYAASHGAKYLEKHFTISYARQCSTEKAHLGSMTAEDLLKISTLSREIELIRKANSGSL